MFSRWWQTVSRTPARVTVDNLEDGEERRYPVILLRGKVSGASSISVMNSRQSNASNATHAIVSPGGEFKVLVELLPGDNDLRIEAGSHHVLRCVKYKKATSIYKVNLVYVVADDGDTTYLTQLVDDKQDFRDKFDTAVKLLQSFTAEQMHQAGFGYKTFSVDFDEHGKAPVSVIRSPETRAHLQTLESERLYKNVARVVFNHMPDERNKKIAIMAFTGYDAVRKMPLGHTALGGDNLALFSCNGMCTWPSSVAAVQGAFSDTTRVDTSKIWDDTNNRPRFWALASTTLGVTLHELGHTFGLIHQPDPYSIMSRGFDYFSRVFVTTEPSLDGTNNSPVVDSEAARWDGESAKMLDKCPWFQPDYHAKSNDTVGLSSDVTSCEAGAVSASASASASNEDKSALKIFNLPDNDERSYPVLLLRGSASGENMVSATCRAGQSETVFEAPVVEGRFKLLVELKPGENQLLVTSGSQQVARLVSYKPRNSDYKLSIAYVTAEDGDTNYLTQFEGDKQNYRDKLDTAVKLLQTFTAEQMRNGGHGAKTFSIDYEDDGKVKVHLIRCPESTATLRGLGQVELYEKVRIAFDKQFPDGDRSLGIAIVACTGYEPATETLLAHTAIGHQRLAVFSSNGICSWPNNINDVVRAFSEATDVDMSRIWDDSNGRQKLWALASTTIGVLLHLLGYSMGLEGQGQDPFSLMSRGFDFFNRFFMLTEPANPGATAISIDDSNCARWDEDSIRSLNESAWL